MKVLIWGDMEGVAGIVHWDQVSHTSPMYQEGRRLYTEEVNAAVRGARAAGAREIIVVDSHGAGAASVMGGPAFNSLIPELMDEHCEFVTHHGWGNYLEPYHEGVDALFFVGIHARGGTPNGVLSHTVSSQVWLRMEINGIEVGEIGVAAAIAGAYNVPLALVTGDTQACAEAVELLGPEIETVAVKHGLSRFSARHTPPKRARRMIEEGARKALSRLQEIRPWQIEGPVEVVFELVTADKLDLYRNIPGVEIEGTTRAISRGATFMEAWERVAPF